MGSRVSTGCKRQEWVCRAQETRMCMQGAGDEGLGNKNSWEWAQATGMGLGDWNRGMGM